MTGVDLKKILKPKSLRDLLFRIYIGIIAFSLIGLLIALVFPRKDEPSNPNDPSAVDKSTYWSDENGTVAEDVRYLTDVQKYHFTYADEYSDCGVSPAPAKLSNNGWNLLLLNKNYILPTDYELDLQYLTGTSVRLESVAAKAFDSMYIDALKSGLTLTAFSGYRNFESQRRLFEDRIYALEVEAAIEYTNGGYYDAQGNYVEPVKTDKKTIVENALKSVCPPGCSDHNAGLSIDIVSQSSDFSNTEEYTWLTKNAHNYGFVLRYPEGKEKLTGMDFQPYCWRFVGINAAKQMKEKNLCLEEYLKGYLD